MLAWANVIGLWPGLASWWPPTGTGSCPPGPPGLVGDAGVGASYRGGADPDLVPDVGLGVDGVLLLLLPWLVRCEVGGWRGFRPWMSGRRPWKAVCMVGSPAGAMATVVAIPLGRVGGGREQLVAWAVLCLW